MTERAFDVVTRDPVDVMYLEVADTLAEIGPGWPRFEALVGSLRGRHFMAAVDEQAGTYRTCVSLIDTDRPEELGLLVARIPGGRYLRARLRGEPPAIYDQIAPTADRLEDAAPWDRSRPLIELYKRHDQIDVLMPIAEGVTIGVDP